MPDGLYEEARNESFEKELVDLSWAEAEINAWNRAGHTLVTLGTLTRGASQSQGISEIE